MNDKRVERLWRREGLKVLMKQPKRSRLWLNDGSCIRLRSQHVDHVWSYDFVHHRTEDGRAYRVLNIIDEFSRECLAIRVKRKLNFMKNKVHFPIYSYPELMPTEQVIKPAQPNRKVRNMVSRRQNYYPVPLPAHNFIHPEQAQSKADNFFERMSKRHSVRDFSDADIDENVIRTAIRTAARAPSGANQQPWHFVAIKDAEMKQKIRGAAEAEEQAFYNGGGGDEWLAALEPIGTGPNKPHITTAPWLIIVFAQRYGLRDDGTRHKHYYVPESVGIASGILITALHNCGLSTLIHTPNPMSFLNDLCQRPKNEKPVMIMPVGYPASQATVPQASLYKKIERDILSVF